MCVCVGEGGGDWGDGGGGRRLAFHYKLSISVGKIWSICAVLSVLMVKVNVSVNVR